VKVGHHCLETLALLCQLREARSRRETVRQCWQSLWSGPRPGGAARRAPSPACGQAAPSGIPTGASSCLVLSPPRAPAGPWQPLQRARGLPLLQLRMRSRTKKSMMKQSHFTCPGHRSPRPPSWELWSPRPSASHPRLLRPPPASAASRSPAAPCPSTHPSVRPSIRPSTQTHNIAVIARSCLFTPRSAEKGEIFTVAPGEILSPAEAMGSDTRSLPVTFPFHRDPSSLGLGRVPARRRLPPQPSPLPGQAPELGVGRGRS